MKGVFKKIIAWIACVCSVGFSVGFASSCADKADKTNDSSPLYQMQDIRKPNSIWDVDKLFSVKPEIREVDVALGEGIQAFKFKSVPYKGAAETWVFAAIGMPYTERPKDGYPAIVLAHGGGGTVSKEWMEYWMAQGYVALAFDSFANQLDESGNKVANPEGGPKESGGGSNLDSVDEPYDSWIYHAVCGAIMSNNILRARAGVDKNRIVMTGNSWGGFVTCMTAGVDKRFAAFASTNGSGFVYNDTTWQKDGKFGGERKQEWIELYDPSSYLPYATKPMMFVSGVDDDWFSAYNRQASADLVKGKVFYSQRTNIDHTQWRKEQEIAAFFSHVLYREENITLISEVEISDGVASFTYENKTFESVKFVYTTSTELDSHLWKWQSVEVTAENGVCSYAIPENTTAFLFETCLTANFGQSTEIVILDKTINYQ